MRKFTHYKLLTFAPLAMKGGINHGGHWGDGKPTSQKMADPCGFGFGIAQDVPMAQIEDVYMRLGIQPFGDRSQLTKVGRTQS